MFSNPRLKKCKEFHKNHWHRVTAEEKSECSWIFRYWLYALSGGIVLGYTSQAIIQNWINNFPTPAQRIIRIGVLVTPILFAHKLISENFLYPFFDNLEKKYLNYGTYDIVPYGIYDDDQNFK